MEDAARTKKSYSPHPKSKLFAYFNAKRHKNGLSHSVVEKVVLKHFFELTHLKTPQEYDLRS